MRQLSFLFALFALTASAQSDRIRVYFNRDPYPAVSSGTLAVSLHNAMDDTIEAYIHRAQYTIDVAVYNANDFSIISALNQAEDRGVQVRYIAEGSNSNTALQNLSSTIPVLFRTDGQGSGMHNKFMSIDADHAGIAWLWTGSANWTQNGLFDDPNNMVFIQDQALALAYRAEFEEMWGGSGPQPTMATSKFGAQKADNTPHSFVVDDVTIECYFSPSDGTTSRIVDAIDNADHSVRAALFAFTNENIGSALLAAHLRPATTVQIDLEGAITPGTQGWYLAINGVDVATHSSDAVQLHHKYAIIDEGTTDDPLVITGSHNWSWFAETINDENTLIIHDATVANLFYQEWHARRNEVVAVQEQVAGPAGLRISPNITAEVLAVTASNPGELTVLDMSGRSLMRERMTSASHTLDVRSLANGAYSLVFVREGSARSARFMVSR